MSQRLNLVDAETARDVLTFVGRSARVAADGIRLQAGDGVLRMSTATLAPQGLLDATPTVLAMRIAGADPELLCDFVVDPATLTADPDDAAAIALPDSALSPAWAGVAPPQSGWVHVGDVTAAELSAVAAHGISLVAAQVPTDAGEDVVRLVRASVWGPLDDTLFDAPRGVAFTADALGFLADPAEVVPVYRADRWTRFSFRRGHVISRGPSRIGLGSVRTTGTAQA